MSDLPEARQLTPIEYRTIMRTAINGFLVIDPQGRFLEVNEAYCRFSGYSQQELLQMRIQDMEAIESREETARRIERIIETGGDRFETKHRCKDGRIIDVEVSVTYLDVDGGRFIAFFHDISDRKQLEDRTRLEKEKLVSIFDGMIDAVYISDPETYEILYANKTLKEAFGKSLVGGLCYKEFQGLHSPCHFCTNEIILRNNGVPYHWEYHNPVLDRDFLIVDRIVDWPDGRQVRLEVATDVTRLKNLEKKLKQTVGELESSNADLRQFVNICSHDLQEPLRMISSYLQLLAKRYLGRLNSDADEFIGFAVDGANRMKQLLGDLLAYSRVGTDSSPFEEADTSLALDQALINLEVAIQDGGAEITADPLPIIRGDGPQLVLLFQNLLANAVKFRGEQPPRIHVRAESGEGEWIFSVRDNGIGIDLQFAERIFIIFQRLHPRDRYGGSGIGLTICKKIVEHHGGRIWVESRPGQGATFFFTIPNERRD
ncbi:MAG: PAS domain S-box protein [Firmicutes bacterium]|nr:PAS domain S-box protein [Bacillota bacterium]